MNNKNYTNFGCVGEFHNTFDHPNPKELQKNILKENPKFVEFRLSLIREEVAELEKAVKEEDLVEVIDALGDILYVTYGMGCALGIDLDKAFNIIHLSNMSKLCNNEQDALDTIEHYKTLEGFENVKVGYKPSPLHLGKFAVYNTETGKILKSKYVKLPNFSEIVKK